MVSKRANSRSIASNALRLHLAQSRPYQSPLWGEFKTFESLLIPEYEADLVLSNAGRLLELTGSESLAIFTRANVNNLSESTPKSSFVLIPHLGADDRGGEVR